MQNSQSHLHLRACNLIPEEEEMGFGKLRVLFSIKKARGEKHDAVIEEIIGNWNEIRAAIDKLEENEQQELREHFNALIEGYDELGDVLFEEM